jgi:hypothetical protein
MITINLNDIREVAEVTIGDHVYKVRRMGAGEELDLSASNRRTFEAMERANKLQKKFMELSATPEEELDQKEVDKLVKQMDKVTAEIRKEQEYQSEAFVKLFDDGGDGSKSRELLKSLSHNEKQKLLEQIFSQKEVLDASKANDAENGSESVTGDE